jgi:hypothetical protein
MVRRTAAIVVAIGVLAAPAASHASAGAWSKPVSISPGFAEDATIAGNGRGDAVIAFSGKHAAFASVRQAHGKLAAPVRLESGGTGRARVFAVGIDREGTVFVGIVQGEQFATYYRPYCCHVQVAIARRGGPFRVHTVSTPGEDAMDPEMKVGRDGTAVVRWFAGDLVLQSIARPGAGFAQPRVVGGMAGRGLLAVDGRGRPLLFGTLWRGGAHTFWARDGDRLGRFGPRYRLHRGSPDDSVHVYSTPQLQPDRGGGVATWVSPPVPKSEYEYEQTLYALAWKRGGRDVLRQAVGTSRYGLEPTLATGPNGHAVIALPGHNIDGWPAGIGIHLLVRGRDRLFRQVPGVAGAGVAPLSVAVNRRGGVVVAWDGTPGGQYRKGSAAVVREPDGSYGPTGHWSGHLASFRDDVSASTDAPQAAIDSAGRATMLMRGERLYAVDYEPGG